MLIYLQHAKHGRKIAYMEAEAVFDEYHGWTRYNPETPSDSEEVVPVNTLGLKRKYTRKSIETEAVIEGV